MNLSSFSQWAQKNRWVWSAIAVIVLWLVLSLVTSRFSLSSLSGILLTASFLTIVALGQTFVVTTGRGNIDLSIPSVITLSAYLALITIRGEDSQLFLGLGIALGIAILIGALNAVLVIFVRIPAIIATLATGYILATATLLTNNAIPGFAVSPSLKEVASGKIFGMPVMVVLAFVLVAITSYVLRYTAYGKCLAAVGQNRTAARLAGVRVKTIVASGFIISSVLAALCGLLLGAYVGGAFLEMGQTYLLQSIAAVVVGGTLIFGGSASAVGTAIASILLILIVTTMQIIGLPPGAQDMIQGIVVILVLVLANEGGSRRLFSRTKQKIEK